MPPLDESFPTIVSALADRYGQPAFVAEGLEPFEAMLAVVLARSVEVRKIAPALAALADAGRIDPPALAGAAPAARVGLAVDALVSLRSSPEGQEGLAAFLEKRPANWVPKP